MLSLVQMMEILDNIIVAFEAAYKSPPNNNMCKNNMVLQGVS